MIPGFLGIPHAEFEGQVSSVRLSTFPICTQAIEFYGGQSDEVFCTPLADSIKPNQQCHWVSNGEWLQVADCKNVTASR